MLLNNRFDEGMKLYSKAFYITNIQYDLFQIGHSFLKQNKIDDAIKWFEFKELIDIFTNSNLHDELFYLAVCYSEKKDWLNAERYIDRYLELAPDSTAGLNNKGWYLYQNGNLEESILYFEKVLKIDEKDDYAWNNLGKVYHDLGKYGDSIHAFEKSIEYGSIDRETYEEYALSLDKAGFLEKAKSIRETKLDRSQK